MNRKRVKATDFCPILPAPLHQLFEEKLVIEELDQADEFCEEIEGKKVQVRFARVYWDPQEKVYKIEYPVATLKMLDEQGRRDLLLHEMMHVLQGHLGRPNRDAAPLLWNIAEDVWINEYLMRAGYSSKFLCEMGFNRRALAELLGVKEVGYLTPELYFSLLQKLMRNVAVFVMADYIDGTDDPNSEVVRVQIIEGVKEVVQKLPDTIEGKMLKQTLRQMLGGTRPGHAVIEVEDYLPEQPPAWYTKLIELLRSDWRLVKARSWKRAGRIMGLPGWPSRYEHSPGRAILAIDISGSVVSNPGTLKWFFRLSKLLAKSDVKGEVWFFDTRITKKIRLGRPLLKPTGGGGTSYDEVVKGVDDKSVTLILATDGYPYKWPAPPRRAKVALVLSPGHGKLPKDWQHYPTFVLPDLKEE